MLASEVEEVVVVDGARLMIEGAEIGVEYIDGSGRARDEEGVIDGEIERVVEAEGTAEGDIDGV